MGRGSGSATRHSRSFSARSWRTQANKSSGHTVGAPSFWEGRWIVRPIMTGAGEQLFGIGERFDAIMKLTSGSAGQGGCDVSAREPMLVHADGQATALRRLELGRGDEGGDRREAFVQNLVHDHLTLLPMAEIEPAFSPLSSICRELPTPAVFVDSLWFTPWGDLVLSRVQARPQPAGKAGGGGAGAGPCPGLGRLEL